MFLRVLVQHTLVQKNLLQIVRTLIASVVGIELLVLVLCLELALLVELAEMQT